MQKHFSHSTHKYIPIDRLYGTNDGSSYLLSSQRATDAGIAEVNARARKKDAELFRFESMEEELAALISVSLKP